MVSWNLIFLFWNCRSKCNSILSEHYQSWMNIFMCCTAEKLIKEIWTDAKTNNRPIYMLIKHRQLCANVIMFFWFVVYYKLLCLPNWNQVHWQNYVRAWTTNMTIRAGVLCGNVQMIREPINWPILDCMQISWRARSINRNNSSHHHYHHHHGHKASNPLPLWNQ